MTSRFHHFAHYRGNRWVTFRNLDIPWLPSTAGFFFTNTNHMVRLHRWRWQSCDFTKLKIIPYSQPLIQCLVPILIWVTFQILLWILSLENLQPFFLILPTKPNKKQKVPSCVLFQLKCYILGVNSNSLVMSGAQIFSNSILAIFT